MLVRVKCNNQTRKEIMDIVSIFRAHIVDLCLTSMVIEVYGKLDKMAAIQLMLEPYGIIEVRASFALDLFRIHTHTHTHTHIYIYIYICITYQNNALNQVPRP